MDLHVFLIPIQSPLPPPSPSHPSGSSQCTSPEHLSHASSLDWLSVSPLIIYTFQCCSLRSSHPCLQSVFRCLTSFSLPWFLFSPSPCLFSPPSPSPLLPGFVSALPPPSLSVPSILAPLPPSLLAQVSSQRRLLFSDVISRKKILSCPKKKS